MSAANDTNGGNARFVRAATKHGTHERVLTALAIGNADPAGVVARFQVAADKFGTLRIRSAHKVQPYMDFPFDLLWGSADDALIRQLAREADVIHLNNSYAALNRLRIRRKPLLLHHHGTLFRKDPARMLKIARQIRAVSAVSTLDLTRPAPDLLHWLPAPYDVQGLRQLRDDTPPHRGPLRIVHAPTNREAKHTQLFLNVVKRLQKTHDVELVLLEGVTNATVLAEKARADIVYDQLAYGYGCNSIEAWGMGVPVIAGADDWTLDRMHQEFNGELPFALATDKTLGKVLTALVESSDMRAEYGDRGYTHALTYHDELPALERLARLYALSIDSYQGPRAQVDPVKFVNEGAPIRAHGQTIDSGVVVVTDPWVIDRLRYLSRRPSFGITEVLGDE